MKIAIIGSGVSGLVAAYGLAPRHEITLFEAQRQVGGHVHTAKLERPYGPVAVDTGFIVYNEVNYPNFTRLLAKLGVATQPTCMSFSVSCEKTGIEYNPKNLNTLFAQRKNLFRPSFYGMIRDILRFFREAKEFLRAPDPELTLGGFLDRASPRYGALFVEQHVLPLGASVWSADPEDLRGMPMLFFARFFENHGFLQASNRTPWRVIQGGSQRYVDALTQGFADRIVTQCPVWRVERKPDHVVVTTRRGPETFDAVIFAVHSDQALKMLGDATPEEREILGAIAFRDNDVVLHNDAGLLPKNRRAWASWNYRISPKSRGGAIATYDMNRLQSISAPESLCVSLNQNDAIAPERLLGRYVYAHPQFNAACVKAQARKAEISGKNRSYYAGAYWGSGFHEDGVVSALDVLSHFGLKIEDLA